MTRSTTTPLHVGLIMDGNRRWAQQKGYPTMRGHAKGQETLRDIARHVFHSGVKYLSVYAFSTENWKRSDDEVSYLMLQIGVALRKYLNEFDEAGIRIIFAGNKKGLSRSIQKVIASAEQKTENNTVGTLLVCLNYGGQQEISDALKSLIASGVTPDEISPERISEHLYFPDVPPIDLVIRTSGEKRISNFMLWRVAYSEMIFIDVLWPDFSTADFDDCMNEYLMRQRRMGA